MKTDNILDDVDLVNLQVNNIRKIEFILERKSYKIKLFGRTFEFRTYTDKLIKIPRFGECDESLCSLESAWARAINSNMPEAITNTLNTNVKEYLHKKHSEEYNNIKNRKPN